MPGVDPNSILMMGKIGRGEPGRGGLRGGARRFEALRLFGQGEEREIVVDLQELIRKAKRASVRSYP